MGRWTFVEEHSDGRRESSFFALTECHDFKVYSFRIKGKG